VTDSFNGEIVGEHPSSEELAAYLSNALTANERAKLEAHLAGCRQCRREVTSARQLLRSHGLPTARRWVVPAAAAAVLAVVLFSSLRPTRMETSSKRGAEDAAVSATMPKIRIVSPASGDTVNGGQVVFVWQRAGNELLYRLTLTDASGRTVWTRDTSDTTLTLPASISLGKRQNYFWLVDALGADGTAITTGTHRFTAGH
jgi:hypothetical protein